MPFPALEEKKEPLLEKNETPFIPSLTQEKGNITQINIYKIKLVVEENKEPLVKNEPVIQVTYQPENLNIESTNLASEPKIIPSPPSLRKKYSKSNSVLGRFEGNSMIITSKGKRLFLKTNLHFP